MTIKEMIKVMQHYENGGEVEGKKRGDSFSFWSCKKPIWDFYNYDYKIKEKQVPTHKEIMSKWWLIEKDRWMKINAYDPCKKEYFLYGWHNKRNFENLESTDIPHE